MSAVAQLKVAGRAQARAAKRRLGGRRFEREFLSVLPAGLHPAARLMYYGDRTADELAISRTIEGFRTQLENTDATAMSYGSPHSGTFSKNDDGKAQPGPANASALSVHAETGTHPLGGLVLRRLVEGLGLGNVLELGTNTGFSGGYFLSASTSPRLVTIEGSADLCRVAEKNLGCVADAQRFRVINAFFEDALDELAATGDQFDCAFIDGQHEKDATLHYADRVASLMGPGGAIVFDDIYWSPDMNNAWHMLVGSGRFSIACDFAWKGVCILGKGPTRVYDLCHSIGRPTPHRDW